MGCQPWKWTLAGNDSHLRCSQREGEIHGDAD